MTSPICEYRGCTQNYCMTVTVRIGVNRDHWPKRRLCYLHGGRTIETGMVSPQIIVRERGPIHA